MAEKQKYRRFILYFLISFLLLGLPACSGGGGGEDEKEDSSSTTTCSGNASQSPLTVTVGSTCEQTSAGNETNSGFNFYRFESATAGIYTISVQNISPDTANLDWQLYSDSSYEDALTTCAVSVTGSETCTATLSASTPYYLIVQNQGTAEVSFSLLITAP